DFDRALIEGCRGAQVTALLGYAPAEVARLSVVRCDLQRVGKLHTRLLELPLREIPLAACDVAAAPGLCASAPRNHDHHGEQREGRESKCLTTGGKHAERYLMIHLQGVPNPAPWSRGLSRRRGRDVPRARDFLQLAAGSVSASHIPRPRRAC